MSRYRPLTCLAVSFGAVRGGGSRIKCKSSICLRRQDQKGGDQPVKHSARFEHAHLISGAWLTICGTFWDQPPRVCSEFSAAPATVAEPKGGPRQQCWSTLSSSEGRPACRFGGACLWVCNLWVNPVLVCKVVVYILRISHVFVFKWSPELQTLVVTHLPAQGDWKM